MQTLRRLGAIPAVAAIAAVVLLVSLARFALAQDSGGDAGADAGAVAVAPASSGIGEWINGNWAMFALVIGSALALGLKGASVWSGGATANPRIYGLHRLVGAVTIDLAGIVEGLRWLILGASAGAPPPVDPRKVGDA